MATLNPFKEHDKLEELDEAIRRYGQKDEGVKPTKKSKVQGGFRVLTDPEELKQDQSWMKTLKQVQKAEKEKEKAKAKAKTKKSKAKEEVYVPQLSRWMTEDVSTGVVYVSCRDIECE